MVKIVERFPAWRHRFVRIFVAQIVEAEADAREQLRAFADRLGTAAEQPRHLLGRLQMPFAIGAQQSARLLDRHPFADAGDDGSEEHTSELQSLMRISYAVFCLKKKTEQYYKLQHKTEIY